MPELPEVETVLRSVAPCTGGRRVIAASSSRLPLRGGRPAEARRLQTEIVWHRLLEWTRRGKYLLASFSSGSSLLIHLGMSGRLLVEATEQPRASHTHVILSLEGGDDLRFVDPRRFGVVQCLDAAERENHRTLAKLGPEPLSRAFNRRAFAKALSRTRRAVKPALLDQRLVAGIGNIYASESLHLAGIDPWRRCNCLGEDEIADLVRAVKLTLRRAIANCGTTLQDYTDGWGVRGDYQRFLRVFARAGEPCHECGDDVESLAQQGRTTFYCPSCQGNRG